MPSIVKRARKQVAVNVPQKRKPFVAKEQPLTICGGESSECIISNLANFPVEEQWRYAKMFGRPTIWSAAETNLVSEGVC